MKILTVTLKQHTPLIHFQHSQYGATLRASEVKPKLDKFLLKKLGGNVDKTWLIGKDDSPALNYKMRIRTDESKIKILLMNERIEYNPQRHVGKNYKEDNGKRFLAKKKLKEPNAPLIYNLKPYPLYFGNMNTDYKYDSAYKRMSFTNESIQIELLIFCDELYDYLLDKKEHLLADFFMTHNFGTRQSKGFGSFYLDKRDALYIEPKAKYWFTLNGFVNQGYNENRFYKLLDNVDLFYKTLRGGINLKSIYFKSLAFMYAKDVLKAHWDKRGVKEAFYNEKSYRRKDSLPEQLSKHKNEESSPLRESFDKAFDVRDMLGFSTNEEWNSFNDIIEKKVAICRDSRVYYPKKEDMLPAYRMASPLLIKVICSEDGATYSVYLISRDEEVGMDEFKKYGKICVYSKREKDSKGFFKRTMLDIPQGFSVDNYLDYIFNMLRFDISKHVDKKFHQSEVFVLLKNIYNELHLNLKKKEE